MILNLPVATSTGYSEVPTNAASLQNRGWEVALNFRPVTTRTSRLDVGVQWARNRSLTTDLAGVAFAPFPFSGGTNGLSIQGVAIEGRPIGVYYGGDFVRCGRGLIVAGVDIDNAAGHCQGAAIRRAVHRRQWLSAARCDQPVRHRRPEQRLDRLTPDQRAGEGAEHRRAA